MIFNLLLVLLSCFAANEAASPLFLQAITSALATIPLTGGPMTTGLVGAKLGIGTKLLYYLGYFGRRPKTNSQQISKSPSSKGVDPALVFQILTMKGVDPNLVIEALNQATLMNSLSQTSATGMNAAYNPSATGMNAAFNPSATRMNAAFNPSATGMNAAFNPSATGMNAAFNPSATGMNAAFNPSATGMNAALKPRPSFQQTTRTETNLVKSNAAIFDEIKSEENEVESFFNFLQDMDENTCISRLICDIGHNPSFLGDFSYNIHSMVSTLQVLPSSRAYAYIRILEEGRSEGNCESKFPECSNISYEIVKNVAPSVGVPQNVDPVTLNSL